jgi:hypothetical protein
VRLERELDRLFGLPLDEFTAARNDLARRLKQEKEDDAAARVRGLAKPTLPVWAVNQLGRHEAAAVRAALAAGDALRKAQKRLLEQGGTGAALRDAVARHRDAIGALTERAEAVLERDGRPVTQPTLERIRKTLEAAVVDDEGRRALKAGRLTEELEPAGFDAFASLTPAPSGRPHPRDELAERRRQREATQRHKHELKERVRELERAASAAEREADRAEAAAAVARRDAEKARAAADEAAAELDELS